MGQGEGCPLWTGLLRGVGEVATLSLSHLLPPRSQPEVAVSLSSTPSLPQTERGRGHCRGVFAAPTSPPDARAVLVLPA